MKENQKRNKKLINFGEEIKKDDNEIKSKNREYKKMEKLAKEFLKIENPDNEILKKLVKKVVFDKNKKITVELTFSRV